MRLVVQGLGSQSFAGAHAKASPVASPGRSIATLASTRDKSGASSGAAQGVRRLSLAGWIISRAQSFQHHLALNGQAEGVWCERHARHWGANLHSVASDRQLNGKEGTSITATPAAWPANKRETSAAGSWCCTPLFSLLRLRARVLAACALLQRV
jgi:hypothetical protein